MDPDENPMGRNAFWAAISLATIFLLVGLAATLLVLGGCIENKEPSDIENKEPRYFTRGDVCDALAEAQDYFDYRCGLDSSDYLADCCDDTSQRRPNHRCDNPVTTSSVEIQRCINDAEMAECVCLPELQWCQDICTTLDINHLSICN